MRYFIISVSIILTSFLLISNSCEKETDGPIETTKPKINEDLISKEKVKPLSFVFSGDFAEMWKKVDSLQDLGLYKSALEVVNVIFDSARKENNSPQVVKAVIHQMKYNSFIAEDDYVLALDGLNAISKNAPFPLKQLIHSVTADVYWGYYQSNRWKFLNRTQTVNFENKDVRTWDLAKIILHVNEHYMLSLQGADSLQQTNINDFSDIIIDYGEDDKLRPTLYDFLAHRALNYFVTTESSLTRPADKFTITGPGYFGSPSEFLTIQTNSNDSISNHLHAVIIFKQLTRFHQNDQKKDALIDLELRRLRFSRAHCTDSNKDELYISALNSLAERFINHPSYSEILYYAAEYHNDIGSTYSTENKNLQWERKKAIEICQESIEKYPKSFGATQCRNLVERIKSKSIAFNSEVAYQPNATGKILVNFQNVDTLYLRMVQVDWDYFFTNRRYGNEQMTELLSLKPVNEWNTVLSNPGDYQSHSTEILVKVPDYGQYIILASPKKEFPIEKNAIAYGSIWSTQLSYSFRKNDDSSYDVFVADRESGEPIQNVKATVYTSKYNPLSRDYELKKQDSYVTNQNGFFSVKSTEEYRNLYLHLSKGNDEFNNATQLYQYRSSNTEKNYSSTHFFTDRGIYRPGQIIYFKGIRIRHEGENHKPEVGKTSTVSLYDANRQKVADLKLTTNEYGTFSGSFIAPSNGLNGSMLIRDEQGSKYISVEEYKRPKFEVEFEPIKGSYKIGQKIEVRGKATSFAGSSIDGASVQFRVQRTTSFPSWIWYRWGYYPKANAIEIKNGTIQSNEKGEFTIEFDALEDPSIDKRFSPYYAYTISADVTDINGETQSAVQQVSVGYIALRLSVEMSSSLDRSSENRFKVSTTNLNGEKIETKGSLQVTRLKEPNRIFRESLWENPDIQQIDNEEYRKLFPHDPINNEDQINNYERGEQVLNVNFNTATSDSVDFIGMKNWAPGYYVVEASSVDSFGETVKDIQYITLIDKKSSKNPTNEIWSFTPVKVNCEPGQTAEFLISSGIDNLKVLYEIEHKGVIISREFITLNKAQKLITIPIEERHRGNITVHFNTTHFGRNFNTKQVVIVPFSNKELAVSFETFRDKLQPGQTEEWRLKIKGPNGEKVAAELLAAMYDASLDQFASNSFSLNVFKSFYSSSYWNNSSFKVSNSRLYNNDWNSYSAIPFRTYDKLNWWGFYFSGHSFSYGAVSYSLNSERSDGEILEFSDGIDTEDVSISTSKGKEVGRETFKNSEMAESEQNNLNGVVRDKLDKRDELGSIQARSNLNETAFFYPQLETDENGEILIKFTIPEALTKWKFIGLAHTKDLKVGYIQEEVITQKELMVVPNAPRFLREGDKMTFTAKISNISKEDLSGSAQLFLFDAMSMEPLDQLFNNNIPVLSFSAKKDQSTSLEWKIEIPEGISAVKYRIVAKAKNHTDGEEMVLPVLSNRMLVTESMPLPSKGIGSKNFTFTKLTKSETSSTLKHHKLTLEYTSNPAWYAIQAMPYMMEYPYECSEQIFTRYYANAMASNIMNSSPKIKEVFESWKQNSPDAFLSNLEKNSELKSLLLQETPWVLSAQNESERKKRVALLFDLNKMDNELGKAIQKLQKLQLSNGGWPWFAGMEDSRFITQHIVTGMGHLDQLGVKNVRENSTIWNMVKKGIKYLDDRILEDYRWLQKHDPNFRTEQRISQLQIQYLYARSYFKDIPINATLKEAFDYYQEQATKYWKNFSLYNEGMIALQAHRYGIKGLPQLILASLKERALIHDELGMYWKDNVSGYYWYQAPIETQALLIEAFDEIGGDLEAVEELKVWLLKQKQTTDWKTTKATAEACYALLLQGTDLLENSEQVEIKVNGQLVDPAAIGAKVEAGTGYFKTSWNGNEIKPSMGNVSVTRKTNGVSWGAMYWQYFENLDKITTHETPLKLTKHLFLVQNTSSGPVITPVNENSKLNPGDKIRVRIELRSDRDMEYIHMKDMRAAGFEPISVFSQYKWQDGLGYYESTGDAATNFFIDFLPKGTYVFEYDLRVSHFGDFSNGITTIQSMYAPEFTSHSEGIRVHIKKP